MDRACVIKVGGAHLDDPVYLDGLARYIQLHQNTGYRVLLLHGGGKEISQLHKQLGLPFLKKQGQRVTPPESMALVTMVLCGLVNKRVVAHMNRFGLQAVGLSGVDFQMMQSELLNEQEFGRVGAPPQVNTSHLTPLLQAGHLVVMAPVCTGPDGVPVNVNADIASQALAVALQAHSLDFVTDVAAVESQDGPLTEVSSAEIPDLIQRSIVRGGMIPKLEAGVAALRGGVQQVRVGNLTTLVQGSATEVCLA